MLNQNYMPMYAYQKDFLLKLPAKAKPLWIALERSPVEIKVYKTKIFPRGHKYENQDYIERVVKFMLWAFGGYKFYIYGSKKITKYLSETYSEEGLRKFDYNFMKSVYNKPLEFEVVDHEKDFPVECEVGKLVRLSSGGYRIGFDAGGSDRKVTACIDGKVVFESEDVWFPKLNSDPEYHKAGIYDSIDRAFEALGGRVDAIGVSTAGIVIDGEVRVASLFKKVPREKLAKEVYPIYKNLEAKYNCPVNIVNDGDVSALAGALETNSEAVLGIALGTSLAAGYIDANLKIKGYLNELAFVPIDAFPNAARDEWSGDKGVGASYLCQEGVISLAVEKGITFGENMSPAEKLKAVQKLIEAGDNRAREVFSRMGDYLGYTLLWFDEFYDISKVIIFGRVASGEGGDIMIERAKKILSVEGSIIRIIIPDEKIRRLGQSYTATLL